MRAGLGECEGMGPGSGVARAGRPHRGLAVQHYVCKACGAAHYVRARLRLNPGWRWWAATVPPNQRGFLANVASARGAGRCRSAQSFNDDAAAWARGRGLCMPVCLFLWDWGVWM